MKDFGEQLQLRVWETLEYDVEVALERMVDKVKFGLSLQSLSPEPVPRPPQRTAG